MQRIVLLAFLTLALAAYDTWAYQSMGPEAPRGWIWAPRGMIATELFQEQGVPLAQVEHFSVVQGMHLGIKDRAKA